MNASSPLGHFLFRPASQRGVRATFPQAEFLPEFNSIKTNNTHTCLCIYIIYNLMCIYIYKDIMSNWMSNVSCLMSSFSYFSDVFGVWCLMSNVSDSCLVHDVEYQHYVYVSAACRSSRLITSRIYIYIYDVIAQTSCHCTLISRQNSIVTFLPQVTCSHVPKSNVKP